MEILHQEHNWKSKRLGPQAFTQCAGFMRILEGKNPLDNTGVHPESYDICKNDWDNWIFFRWCKE